QHPSGAGGARPRVPCESDARPRWQGSGGPRTVSVPRRTVGRARRSLCRRGARGRQPPRVRDATMCGIAGLVSLTGKPTDPTRVGVMVATLGHRGPDDYGVFAAGPAAIGAARLSIIDVQGGHQPISIDNGAITIVQNGEIYNYI